MPCQELRCKQYADELQELHRERYAPLMSVYLDDSFKNNKCEITSLRVGPAIIKSVWNMTACELPSDGIFFLPADVAFRMVGQLVIIHAGWFFNLEKKMGEALLRDYSIRYRRKILKSEGIEISVRIPSPIHRVANTALYSFKFSISDDFFNGSGTPLVTVG